jgi:phosphatidylserine synthase
MSVRTCCVRNYSFVFCRILFIFGILVDHDLSMCILYQFHGWFIFARVIALFMFVWPYVHSHILCTQLKSFVVCHILFIFGILIGHDLRMPNLYRFHGWLIFVRVIALFMFVWPYVRPHILCTQLIICLLTHFIHIWYLDWPWSEHAHIIPISQMVDYCESYSPFHVCLTIRQSAHLVYATSHLSFVAFYS